MKYLFLDLETTGLSPLRCAIVEIAGVLTENDQVLERFSFWGDQYHYEGSPAWDEPAYKMHEKSGLLVAWKNTQNPSVYTAQNNIIALLEKHVQLPDKIMLAGFSVHFDRTFIHERMVALDERLHYRHLDISCLDTFMADALGVSWPRPNEPAHRASTDAEQAFRRYCRYRKDVGEKMAGYNPGAIGD